MKKPSDFTKEKIKALWSEYKNSGGTQVALSAATGINQGQLSDYIRGNRLPSVDGLVALAEGFGVPVSDFFPGSASEPENTALTGFKRELFNLIAGLDEAKAEGLLRIIRRTLEISGSTNDLHQPQVLSKKPRR